MQYEGRDRRDVVGAITIRRGGILKITLRGALQYYDVFEELVAPLF